MLSFLRLECNKEISYNPCRIRMISFFLINNNRYVHALMYSLEYLTRIQTSKGKDYTRLQTKPAQKAYPLGRQLPIKQL